LETLFIGVWVGPEQISDRSFMGDFIKPIQDPKLIERVDRGGKTAVNGEKGTAHNGC
jgi:hypothetical protein